MAVVSRKKASVRRKIAQQKYESIGASAVYRMGNKLKMEYKPCTPCAAQTPSLQTIDTCECLICGAEQNE